MNKIIHYLNRLNVYKRMKWLEQRLEELREADRRDALVRHSYNALKAESSSSNKRRIHFIHIFGTNNVGDEFCGVEYYYGSFYKNYEQYVHNLRSVDYSSLFKDDVVVIGGGGLIDYSDFRNECINKCIQKCDNVVLWGCGFNTHNDGALPSVKVDFNKISLIGLRDYNTDYNYIPCVSCMLPQLAVQYEIKRRIGIVEHKQFPIDELSGYERITNNTEDVGSVIRFIGESEIVVTNSYHAWYWATLMQKKVILYKSFSTKFDNLRYKPVYYSGNLEKDIECCSIYPEAYVQAIKLNNEFANKVMEILNS